MTQWKAREDSDVDSVCLRNRLAHVKYLLQLDDKALRDLAINADPLLLQLSLHDLTSRMISLRAALPHTCDMFEMVHSEVHVQGCLMRMETTVCRPRYCDAK